ncbi:NADH dehydrogenase-like protein YjlD [Novipirellula aureliae]|uniref:NADH dehydrogenase-like protein YjlD n=1 Tax=Novipirellula aureliae TaxID=2527966 RepID=A0A5C6E700_9BACT|nr:FAD-dependent oxidoreductase [Novipirellula aureliae]TWU43246.1 NADH dehydrogenase-like protein YjlD [Novipirellula aureliae]
MNRKRIVLLGVGHTNAHVVKQWADDPIPDCDLVCISNFGSATYSGMLPGTLGWQFSDDEMRIDLASLCARSHAELVIADTCGIDLDAGQLLVRNGSPISFDALSIGVGSIPAGANQYSGVESFVPIKPMQTFLERLEKRLQSLDRTSNSNVRITIVGGGVASVEIAFCLQEQIRKRAMQRNVEIAIFTSDDSLAGGMTRRSVRRIEKLLNIRGIKVHYGHRVIEVDHQSIVTDDGVSHETECVIWATGAAAPPVLKRLGLTLDDRGFIATSETLQSLSDPRIFAVGDSGTILKSPSPKAGVYAVRQCPILEHNLRAYLQGSPLHSFEPQSNFLKILNTGDGRALLEYKWFTAHARWCWKLKMWIDQKFVESFR